MGFLICVILYSSYNLIKIFLEYKAGDELYESARDEFVFDNIAENLPKEDKEESGIEASAGKAQEIPLGKRIDFNKLKDVNEDIIGWINIKGTTVDYPLLMNRKSNDDYIYTSYKKKYSSFGSIFVDYRNNDDFTDKNTIIYGHNMKNGAMFGNLMKYGKLEYAKNNQEIKILREDGIDVYEIYSAYRTVANSESYDFSFNDDKDFKKFIDITNKKTVVDLGVKAEITDRVITLSTCTDTGRTANRYVVHAIYKETEEK